MQCETSVQLPGSCWRPSRGATERWLGIRVGSVEGKWERPWHSAQACQRLNHGQEYIRIHEVREAFGWPRERFDRSLEALRDDGALQLHTGDVSTMSREEVHKSYVDENTLLGRKKSSFRLLENKQ